MVERGDVYDVTINQKECGVCLTLRPDHICLDVFEPQGDESDKEVPYLVWKHVGLQFTQGAEPQFICCDCWKALQEFNRFYMMVQDVHTQRTSYLAANRAKPDGPNQTADTVPIANGVHASECEAIAAPAPLAYGEQLLDPATTDVVHNNGIPVATAAPECPPRGGLVEHAESERIPCAADTDRSGLEPEGSHVTPTANTIVGTPSRKRKNQEMDEEILDFYKRLVCDVCDDRTEYGTLKELNHHMKLAHGEESGRVGCPQCGKKFRTRVKLLEHKQTHVPRMLSDGETDADKVQSAQVDQEILEFYKRISCDVCDGATPTPCSTLYPTVRELNHHMRLVHGQQTGTVKCPLCEKKIRTRPKLLEHKRLHLPEAATAVAAPPGPMVVVVDDDHGRSPDVSPEQMEEQTFDVEIFEFYKPITCEMCDPDKLVNGEPVDEYRTLRQLNHHMRTAHGLDSGTIKCKLCAKKFRTRVKLVEHKEMHQNPDRFRCTVCQEVHQNLEEHMQNKHQDWEFCCEECGKRFPFKSRLTAHMGKVHQKKDIICEECNKPFTKFSIEKHKRTVHGSYTTFTCENCPKTFKTRVSLDRHMEAHNGGEQQGSATVSCTLCNSVLKDEYNLKTHMKRIHAEQTPSTCKTCGKTFKSKHSLNTHISNVCTTRQFPCTVCGKQFKKRTKLKQHMTTAHARCAD
ncbi:oocyte zinc finger protein XlCOF6-like [Anopheles bellator]|uniref:oocyte zinc finger protein XlCOF6-like n=1 Tax=Anopheles bellator TaxID=139047 RepID=UPI002649B7B3|nr:oocyte zinc finger protein XlCOF6-like [Anopheles bellator]